MKLASEVLKLYEVDDAFFSEADDISVELTKAMKGVKTSDMKRVVNNIVDFFNNLADGNEKGSTDTLNKLMKQVRALKLEG